MAHQKIKQKLQFVVYVLSFTCDCRLKWPFNRDPTFKGILQQAMRIQRASAINLTCTNTCSGVFKREGQGAIPPFGPTMKLFTCNFIWKGACIAIFQQELHNSTMFDHFLSIQYDVRSFALWDCIWYDADYDKRFW